MSSLFLTSHLSWLKIWLLPISVENVGNTRARSMCSRPGRSAECWAEPCSVRGTAVIPQQQGLQAGYRGTLTARDSKWAVWLNFLK